MTFQADVQSLILQNEVNNVSQRLFINQHMDETRRLLTAISSFELNADEGIASCVLSKQLWTPISGPKRDFPRGKMTAISG